MRPHLKRQHPNSKLIHAVKPGVLGRGVLTLCGRVANDWRRVDRFREPTCFVCRVNGGKP